MVSKALVSKLAGFSSCEVADALIKLKLPHGGYLPGIDMYSPQFMSGQTSICGPAFTMVDQRDTNAPKPPTHFVDAAEPESVMLISTPPTTRSAIWGGLMTARAQSLGVRGVVLDGRCRDLGEHRASAFPVFARGHSILGQSPFTRPSQLQIPLEIADPSVPMGADGKSAFPPVTVYPGDLLLADVDGVVSVPQDLVEQVVEHATHGRAVDGLCMQDLRAGHAIQATFAERRGKAKH
ncbi:hypothetical protein MVES_003749 [Malassezia vespertilionis]|uniref:RraA-like protein n=1 Tax=Malassezia vespertilionis TaxID=2020962 RepID=A0A2N1J735_9BASI|nr:hypothetical protein MVES_003749 [Malassezia vespertilionis]